MLHEYKAYLENFMMDFDFPKEAQAELNDFYQKVFSDIANFQALTSILDGYKASKNVDYHEMLPACKKIAEQSNVCEYVIYALTLIMMTHSHPIPKLSKTVYSSNLSSVPVLISISESTASHFLTRSINLSFMSETEIFSASD